MLRQISENDKRKWFHVHHKLNTRNNIINHLIHQKKFAILINGIQKNGIQEYFPANKIHKVVFQICLLYKSKSLNLFIHPIFWIKHIIKYKMYLVNGEIRNKNNNKSKNNSNKLFLMMKKVKQLLNWIKFLTLIRKENQIKIVNQIQSLSS